MLLVENISEEARQKHTLILPNGKQVEIILKFIDAQIGWFIDISYEDFVLYNRRIVTGYNIIRSYKNILPFGLACLTDDNNDPLLIDAFSSEYAKFYILTSDDVEIYEDYLSV